MEDLKAKLETAYKASGGRKVNIISHSMGGLLLLSFLSLHSDVSKFSLRLVESLIKFHWLFAEDMKSCYKSNDQYF